MGLLRCAPGLLVWAVRQQDLRDLRDRGSRAEFGRRKPTAILVDADPIASPRR